MRWSKWTFVQLIDLRFASRYINVEESWAESDNRFAPHPSQLSWQSGTVALAHAKRVKRKKVDEKAFVDNLKYRHPQAWRAKWEVGSQQQRAERPTTNVVSGLVPERRSFFCGYFTQTKMMRSSRIIFVFTNL
ncbi:MAG: hypothetical protein Q8P30_04835 [Candidatus Uhrbacteria bacterium]|nr:hypothetical protein [Candidatus Uhrbacteria bacterium]